MLNLFFFYFLFLFPTIHSKIVEMAKSQCNVAISTTYVVKRIKK